MPELRSVSNSDGEEDGTSADWFSEVGDDDVGDCAPSCNSSEELSGVDGSECGSFVDVDPDSDSVDSRDYVCDAPDVVSHEEAAAVTTGEANLPRSELYDSGSTRHITPFRDELTNFVEITPQYFNAANKSSFSVIGCGDMVIGGRRT
jgi:hypothetical protein